MLDTNKLRQIQFVRIILCAYIPWCVFYCTFPGVFSGNFNPGITALDLLVPPLISCIIASIVNYRALTRDRIPLHRMIFAVIILVALDQGIKLIVGRNQDVVISIIDGWIEYQAALHTLQKGHVLNEWGIFIPQFMYVIVLFPPLLLFRVAKFCRKNIYSVSVIVYLVYSTIFSFYLDALFYGGSYDYIALHQFGIFDLKDVYFALACPLLFQTIFYKPNPELSEREETFGRYFRYELANIKRFFSKKA